MKTLLRLIGLVVTVAVIVGASRLWAENKGKKPAPRTRIGLLNLTFVLKNYEKYKHFQEEVKNIVGPFQKRDNKLRARLEKLRPPADKEAKQDSTHLPPLPLPSYLVTPGTKKKPKKESPIKPAKAEEEDLDETVKPDDVEAEVKKIQRELEDNSAECKLTLGKKSDEEMRILFLDVYDAAQRYASTHDLDLVMHYNDAIDRKDYLSSQNIARKLHSGAIMPIYLASGIDISTDITEMLNKKTSKK